MNQQLYNYHVCGLKIRSEFDLDFPQTDFKTADITFKKVAVLPRLAPTKEFFRLQSPAAEILVLENKEVFLAIKPSVSDETVRLEIIHTVLVELLIKRKVVCLHGCVVNKGGLTAGFIAPSGTGKSTLSALFVKNGWNLLSDDLLLLVSEGGNISVIPSFLSIRLWKESVKILGSSGYNKKPVSNRPGKYVLTPTVEQPDLLDKYKLTHLYSLKRELGLKQAKIKALDKKDLFWQLMKNTFGVQHHNSCIEKHRFELFAQLHKNMVCKSVRLPDGFGLLESSVVQIINDINQ